MLSLSYGKIKRKNIKSKKGLLPNSFDTYQIVKDGIANGDLADKMDSIKQTVADADDKLVQAAMSAVKSGYKTGE